MESLPETSRKRNTNLNLDSNPSNDDDMSNSDQVEGTNEDKAVKSMSIDDKVQMDEEIQQDVTRGGRSVPRSISIVSNSGSGNSSYSSPSLEMEHSIAEKTSKVKQRREMEIGKAWDEHLKTFCIAQQASTKTNIDQPIKINTATKKLEDKRKYREKMAEMMEG